MIKFEKVSRFNEIELEMPSRKTSDSAGYDFIVAEEVIIPPYNDVVDDMIKKSNYYTYETISLEEMASITKSLKAKVTLVSTGMKCYLPKGYYLELSVRSSTPLKHWLILGNGVGIIDADYADNEDNEGEIFFQLINLSPFPIQLKRGDRIGQGIIKKYEVTDDDNAEGERTGGFGSTSASDMRYPMAATMAIEPGNYNSRGLRAQAGLIEDAMGYNDPTVTVSTGKQINVNFNLNTEIDKAIQELEKYKLTSPNCLYNFEVGM
jgi:dUTP pyrophosphatase